MSKLSHHDITFDRLNRHHTHLLPGIDDGCKSVAESIMCAQGLVAAGYMHAFCTPHIWPSFPENGVAANLLHRVRDLQNAFDRGGIPLTLLPGGELNITSCQQMIQEAGREKIVTYGLYGKWVLYDFWTASAADVRERVFPPAKRLAELGFAQILAHPERIEVFHLEPRLLDELAAMGVRFQLNSWCLTEPARSPVYRLAERLLKEGRYFIMGTDLHNPGGLEIRMRGLEIARRMVGEEAVSKLTVDHPRLLLQPGDGL